MIKSLILGLGILGASNAYAGPPSLPLGVVFASAEGQSLIATPPPNVAPAQTSNVTDRDYILQLINERDRQYSQRFDAQEKAVSAALAAASAAVAKAEAAMEKRFDGVNEFRAQLKDQQQTFMPKAEVLTALKQMTDQISILVSTQIPRSEYAQAHKQLSDQITDIAARQVPRAELETRWQAEETNRKQIQDRVEAIAVRQYREAGASEGQNLIWGIITGGVGLLIGVGALILNLFRRTSRDTLESHRAV